MSGGWAGSDRKSRLPLDWAKIVASVKRRAATPHAPGGQCEAIRSTGRRCTTAGTDVDHIEPGDDHSMANLQLLCRWHHAAKSSREGNEAKRAQRAQVRRPQERHPGVTR